MILFIVVFCVLIALGFGVAAGIADFKSMNIPNSLSILLAFIPAYAADAFTGQGLEYFAGWQSHLIAVLAVFAVTFILFGLKLIGAGDSKLCSAYALWVALPGLAPFLFYMTVIGAVLAIATKIMNKRVIIAQPAEGSWIAKAQGGFAGVPYGIAITLGATIAFYQLGYFSPEKLALLAGYTEIADQP
jgi:prepilin peptidase CpaA